MNRKSRSRFFWANGASIRAMPFMLDTNVINRILDGEVENEWSLRGDIFVTDIQLQEILDTRDPSRRNILFRGLMNLHPNVIRPSYLPQWFDCDQDFDTGERLPWTLPVVEYAYAADVPLSLGRFVPLIARRLPVNRKRPENPLRDGFIAEAALLNGMTLVTADSNLGAAAQRFGVPVELIS
jgi:predicted nucleic acid-binding protein